MTDCHCNERYGGPRSGQEKCYDCGKSHFVYRLGSFDYGPKYCDECRKKYPNELEKLVEEKINGSSKEDQPTKNEET